MSLLFHLGQKGELESVLILMGNLILIHLIVYGFYILFRIFFSISSLQRHHLPSFSRGITCLPSSLLSISNFCVCMV